MASPPDKSPVWITPDPHLARFQSNQMKESDIENDSDYKFLGRLKKKTLFYLPALRVHSSLL